MLFFLLLFSFFSAFAMDYPQELVKKMDIVNEKNEIATISNELLHKLCFDSKIRDISNRIARFSLLDASKQQIINSLSSVSLEFNCLEYIAFSSDYSLLATTAKRSIIQIIELPTGKILSSYQTNKNEILHIQWDGEYLLVLVNDYVSSNINYGIRHHLFLKINKDGKLIETDVKLKHCDQNNKLYVAYAKKNITHLEKGSIFSSLPIQNIRESEIHQKNNVIFETNPQTGIYRIKKKESAKEYIFNFKEIYFIDWIFDNFIILFSLNKLYVLNLEDLDHPVTVNCDDYITELIITEQPDFIYVIHKHKNKKHTNITIVNLALKDKLKALSSELTLSDVLLINMISGAKNNNQKIDLDGTTKKLFEEFSNKQQVLCRYLQSVINEHQQS